MAIDYPASPTVGQQYTAPNGVTWIWDGVKWTSTSAATGLYLPLTGGAMTGDLILNRDAVAPLQAATYEQVQARGAGDNRIINGDMRIDQRNAGAAGTAANVYTADRWNYGASQASKLTWQRVTLGAGGLASGLGYALQFTSSSAYTPLAADNFAITQFIEADTIGDFAWGTASAQSATLSFWAQSSLTGTFGGSIQNYAGTRSYPFSYSLPIANTWTKIVVPISGDTTGTWVLQGNAGSMGVGFDLGVGTSKRGPAGAWAGANYLGATGAVNVVATNGATFYLTGVKLEIGSVATPFNRQSLAKSMADCQRYFQKLGGVTASDLYIAGYSQGAAVASANIISFPPMRSAATASPVGSFSLTNISTVNFLTGSNSMSVQLISTAAGAIVFNNLGSQYIRLDAEF